MSRSTRHQIMWFALAIGWCCGIALVILNSEADRLLSNLVFYVGGTSLAVAFMMWMNDV